MESILITVAIFCFCMGLFKLIQKLIDFHFEGQTICTLPGYELPKWSNTFKRLWKKVIKKC